LCTPQDVMLLKHVLTMEQQALTTLVLLQLMQCLIAELAEQKLVSRQMALPALWFNLAADNKRS
ncbi:MAG TPA: hypothetical protein VGE32_07580, partial [Cellvibrio sp.]